MLENSVDYATIPHFTPGRCHTRKQPSDLGVCKKAEDNFPKARLGMESPGGVGMFTDTSGTAPAYDFRRPLGPGCSGQRRAWAHSPGLRSPYSRGGRRRQGRAAAPSRACSFAAPRRKGCTEGRRPARRGPPPPWRPPGPRAASRASETRGRGEAKPVVSAGPGQRAVGAQGSQLELELGRGTR